MTNGTPTTAKTVATIRKVRPSTAVPSGCPRPAFLPRAPQRQLSDLRTGSRRSACARLASAQSAVAVIHPNSEVTRTPTSRSHNGEMTSRNAPQNAS